MSALAGNSQEKKPMRDRYFIDTNIFVYSFDPRDKSKQKKAKEIIGTALSGHNGIISFQVIQEFISLAAKKFATPFASKEQLAYLEEVLDPLCAIHSSTELYRKAITTREETGFSYYDSLILAAAMEGGCQFLYSEDLQHGHKASGVKIINPFKG